MKTESELTTTRPSSINRIKKQRRSKRYQTQKIKDLERKKNIRTLRKHVRPSSAVKNHLTAIGMEVPQADLSELTKNWKTILEHCDYRKKITIEDRITFWNGLATSKYPMFVKRASMIRNAGQGVFVTPWYPYCPKGAMLPFHGIIWNSPSPPTDRDCIGPPGNHYVVLTPFEEPTVHFGNFVNNPLSSDLAPEEYRRRVHDTTQRLDVQNCKLEGHIILGSLRTHTYRMETMKTLLQGVELLGPYGRAYRAGHRQANFAVRPSDPPTPLPSTAAEQPRWPEWSSRT